MTRIASLLGRRRARRKPPEEPLYFGRLKHLGDDKWRAALDESPSTAARWVEAAAVYGNVDAQLYWAQMLLDGYGTARDPVRAFRWFGVAAESGRADALNMVGRCHERGWGTTADLGKAAELYRAAADKADNWGRFNLACLLMSNPKDLAAMEEAFSLLASAAQEGHGKSLYRIGLFYEHGWGRECSRSVAMQWYRRSAEANDFRGQYRYGRMLLDEGMRDEALSWIGRCISGAPAGFCIEIAPELINQPDPDLRLFGASALERCRPERGSDTAS